MDGGEVRSSSVSVGLPNIVCVSPEGTEHGTYQKPVLTFKFSKIQDLKGQYGNGIQD